MLKIKIKYTYTDNAILFLTFLGYYYGHIEFERSYSYWYPFYMYIKFNEMRFSINPHWSVSIVISFIIQFYPFYKKGMYTIGNYTIYLNCILYILINTIIVLVKFPFYIINIGYTYISRRFLNRPEYIYDDPIFLQRTIDDNNVAPVFRERTIGNNNNFQGERPDKCGICFDNLDETDSSTNCGHYFHRTCLMKWLIHRRTTRCLTCKSELELSNEELTEINGANDLQDVEIFRRLYRRYNYTMFDYVINYIDRYTPRLNDGEHQVRLRFINA